MNRRTLTRKCLRPHFVTIFHELLAHLACVLKSLHHHELSVVCCHHGCHCSASSSLSSVHRTPGHMLDHRNFISFIHMHIYAPCTGTLNVKLM